MSLVQAPAKYTQMKGNADPTIVIRANLVYDAICKVLSERKEQVLWEQFTQAEWQLFAQMAENEGVAPLLYWYLGKLGSWELGECKKQNAESGIQAARVPIEVQQFLQGSYYKTAARNA